MTVVIRVWMGSWKEWLKICCVRIADYLYSENPDPNILVENPEMIITSTNSEVTSTQKACAICQKYVWHSGKISLPSKREFLSNYEKSLEEHLISNQKPLRFEADGVIIGKMG